MNHGMLLGELSTHTFQVLDCRVVSVWRVFKGEVGCGRLIYIKRKCVKELFENNRDLLKGSETTDIFSTFALIT